MKYLIKTNGLPHPEPPMAPPPGIGGGRFPETPKKPRKKPKKKEFTFKIEKINETKEKTSKLYSSDQKKKLIEDVWAWLHEGDVKTITIKKVRTKIG